MKYNPQKIERMWQEKWEEQKLHETTDAAKGRTNYMLLTEFPYPSGNLHIGHWYAFALPDIRARYLRMRGYNVLYPIGFDAFGLPAENAAIERGVNPRDWTEGNIAYMTEQLASMGASFDWSRKVSTIDPEYYRWTQWMFLRMYEKGLAYRGKTKVNWCPKDKTVLANEQVVGGCCERCDTQVEQREIEQWMFRITAYADRLVDDLEDLDWPETAKIAQRNWIGRSEGARIKFSILNFPALPAGRQFPSVEAFTTRVDTLFGATFIVISPELAQKWVDDGWQASKEIRDYINVSLKKRELERLEEQKEKTGVNTGLTAVNPINEKEIPIWIADYVLGAYGTGAIMAVPAHDERDFEFAKKFEIKVIEVIKSPAGSGKEECYEGEGVLVNSGKYNGEKSENARIKITEDLHKGGHAQNEITYRLHDWILSRQRYWGVPIPMIKCGKCDYVQVPDEDLPVKLPDLDDYLPTDDGRSPLAKAKDWVGVKCPKCGGKAERETDTMDTFVDSSWYYLRYTDPNNKKEFASEDKMKNWLPVPLYVGGAEHNTMHLLYSRFFAKVLYDLGYIEFDEPFTRRINRGIVLGPDGQKMSKSRGNVIDPDAEVERYGADTVRMFLAFMAPYEQGGPWDPKGIIGVRRFLDRVWSFYRLVLSRGKISEIEGDGLHVRTLHRAVKKIGDDFDELKLNTAVSEVMKLLNFFEQFMPAISPPFLEKFAKLLAPLAPHFAEELWQTVLGHKTSIHLEPWPEYDEKFLGEKEISLPVQVNGKVRDAITVAADALPSEIQILALEAKGVQKYVGESRIKKIIIVQGKIVSIVV